MTTPAAACSIADVVRNYFSAPNYFLFRFLIGPFGAAGFGTSSAVQKTPPWWASAMASPLGFSFARTSAA